MRITIILLIISIQFGIGQTDSTGYDFNKVDLNNHIWTTEQAYQMVQILGIKDTFFTSENALKPEYELLLYLPQPDFNNYCRHMAYSLKKASDFNNYFKEVKEITTIEEWVNLLVKYPYVGQYFLEDSELLKYVNGDFNLLLTKLRNREFLIFIEDSAVVVVRNTREEYEKHKHLKRLK